jgi:ABC-type glycerol-3-phosphate transport system permease component
MAARTLGKRLLFGCAVFAILAGALVPFLWIVRTSLQTNDDVAAGVNSLLPHGATLANYRDVFTEDGFLRPLLNSALICLSATVLTVLFATLAGYSLSRLIKRGSGTILGFILLAGFFPVLAMVGPLFLLYRNLGFLDSDFPLTFLVLIYSLPLAIWLLKNFFDAVPVSLEEAAMIDGASRLQVLRRIVVPVAMPAVFTAGILSFILTWNDFAFALSFLQSQENFTAPLAIVNLGQSQYQVFFNRIGAAVVVVSLPIALLVLAAQRRLVSGLTAGALK